MKLLSHIRFLLTSKNQHGIHSPFVYQWVTQCLYAYPKLGKEKTLGVALKSIGYFGCHNLLLPASGEAEKIKQKYPDAAFGKAPYDFVLLNHADVSYLDQLLEKGRLHNNSMILIKNIHTDKRYESLWTSLIASTRVTVSINLFHCGVIFLRKEQEKEHFNIRI